MMTCLTKIYLLIFNKAEYECLQYRTSDSCYCQTSALYQLMNFFRLKNIFCSIYHYVYLVSKWSSSMIKNLINITNYCTTVLIILSLLYTSFSPCDVIILNLLCCCCLYLYLLRHCTWRWGESIVFVYLLYGQMQLNSDAFEIQIWIHHAESFCSLT